MRGKAHDPALRAKVVAELVTGNAPTEVAERYSLPERTVYEWLDDARSSQFVRDPGARAHAREDLVSLVAHLVAESIASLTAQARFAGTDSWLKEQGASGLADYRGVEFDRLIRLLAAFRPVEQQPISDGNERALAAESGAAD